jgi:4-aminobutyrate aminotransferase-like enzyme
MLRTQKEFTVRLFQQHVGLFFKYGLLNAVLKNGIINKPLFMSFAIKIGIKGMSDLYGIITDKNGVGRFLAIEIKTGNATQTKEQKRYEKIIKQLGGIYIVGREVEQVINDIKRELNE